MAARREGGGRDLNWAVRLVVGGREHTGRETEKKHQPLWWPSDFDERRAGRDRLGALFPAAKIRVKSMT